MATASPKTKFDAAVKVIHSLPKDGPFQPSKEMMLLFYGYYKQATEGPCKSPKPSFWDIVKKAKWEAWSKLGDMDPEVAMVNYVEELKKTLKDCTKQWDEMSKNGDPRIVEAMPQTQTVGDFMTVLGNFYEIVDEDAMPTKAMSNGDAPLDDGYITERSTDTSGEQDTLESIIADVSRDTEHVDEESRDGESDDEETDVQPEMDDVTSDVTSDNDARNDDSAYMNGGLENMNGGSEKTSIISSDSEEEFMDTSADLENFLRSQENKPTQNGPISQTIRVKSSKTNHVRFADTSGLNSDNEHSENIHVAQGFPFISPGEGPNGNGEGPHVQGAGLSVKGEESITVETVSSLQSAGYAGTGKLNMKVLEANTTRNNSNVVGVVDEGDDPPDDRRNKARDREQKSGQDTRRSGSSRNNLQGGVGRRSLLGGGAGGGAGGGSGEQGGPSQSGNSTSDPQITAILVRLQQDMANVLDRLNRLEVQSRQERDRPSRNSLFNIWPFTSQTGRAAFFFLVWPVLVHLFLSYMFRRRRKK